MSDYESKLRQQKKVELSQKVFLSGVDGIWEMSLMAKDEQEFVDFLMTVDDPLAIEEFFNKCHDQNGRFCGGGTSSRGGMGPNRGPGSRIPAPIDYLKTTIQSAWRTRQQRQKSKKLKQVTGPLLGITGPYGVRLNRLKKADIKKFSDKDLGMLKTRLQSNQRKFNYAHTESIAQAGYVAGIVGIAAVATGLTAVINPAGVAGIAYGYGLARYKTKRIPGQIRRIDTELGRRRKSKVSAEVEDLITFQADEEENLPTLEQEIAEVTKILQGMNPQKLPKPSQAEINAVLDLLAAVLEDEDTPEDGKNKINKMFE